jgi:fumarylacetoacetate (FAA) hydrolase
MGSGDYVPRLPTLPVSEGLSFLARRMKLVSFHPDRQTQTGGPVAGVILGETVIDLCAAARQLGGQWSDVPDVDLGGALLADGLGLHGLRSLVTATGGMLAAQQPAATAAAHALRAAKLSAPIPQPTSVRDFYAFEQHVKAARARRGLEMVPEWYEVPVFYYSNHNAIVGPDGDVLMPRATQQLDFELEVACVIAESAVDVTARHAHELIAGLVIMNDWSARDVQRREMKMNLGPAKGKDFATSLGPWLVTLDELEDVRIDRGDAGSTYDLEMVARVNGKRVSRDNLASITFTFDQMIERASQDTWLYPGDVIGSGTCGTGCILELGPEAVGGWLASGDVVELEVERLGVLRNRIV